MGFRNHFAVAFVPPRMLFQRPLVGMERQIFSLCVYKHVGGVLPMGGGQ